MRTIGAIGGMSWESSLEYYRIINQEIKKSLGGLSSARMILYSLDFSEISKLQHEDKWEDLTKILIKVAKDLELMGAEGIVICTNTMHLLVEEMEKEISIPIIHIVDETGKKINEQKLKKVGLLGTIYTMDKPLYKEKLMNKYNIETITPSIEDKKEINRIIYEELVIGKIKELSKEKFIQIIQKLVENGAEGIILGCTEIPLLVNKEDVNIPIFDTTLIHANAAVNFMLT